MSDQQLAVREAAQIVQRGFDSETVDLIRKTVGDPRNPLSSDELSLFLAVCQHTGLNPLLREIYPLKIDGRLTIWTGIDGHRRIAQASPRFRGMAGPHWCGPDGKWTDVWLEEKTPPVACRVGVYLPGRQEPTWGIAYYKNYRNRTSATWKNQPEQMLAIRAESFALRKCFSRELAGIALPDDEELDRPAFVDAEGVIDDAHPSRARAIAAAIDAEVAAADAAAAADPELDGVDELVREISEEAGTPFDQEQPPDLTEKTKLACAAFVDEVKAANPKLRIALPPESAGEVGWRQWLLDGQKKWAASEHNPKNRQARARS